MRLALPGRDLTCAKRLSLIVSHEQFPDGPISRRLGSWFISARVRPQRRGKAKAG